MHSYFLKKLGSYLHLFFLLFWLYIFCSRLGVRLILEGWRVHGQNIKKKDIEEKNSSNNKKYE